MMVDDATIREWARQNHYQVGERGRLQENVKEAYFRAFPDKRPQTAECVQCSRVTYHATWCPLYVEPMPVSEYVDDLPAADVAPEAPSTPVETSNAAPALSDATAMLTAALEALTATQAAPLDESRVREIATDVALEVAAEVATPKVFQIVVPAREVKAIGGSLHHKFADLVKIVGAGLHAYLVGTPGTGKTTLCSQVADALGLEFSFVACGPQMSETKLLGYKDAMGNYQRTEFRDRVEYGGLFLFGEIDNAYPGVVTVMNTVLSNGIMAFPDGTIKVHDDFRCMADANTFGTGATRQFVGRNQLDAATLDRFVCVVIDIDEELESAIAVWPENVDGAREWIGKVRGWRANAQAANLSVLITPRASIFGVKLLRAGFDENAAADMCIWKGLDATTRAKIERGY